MENTPKSLKRSVTSGSAWGVAAQVAFQGAFFLISIVLARRLAAEEFGLIGIVLPFIAVVNIVGNAGIGASVIQKKEISDIYVSTAFWTNIALGALLCCVGILISPYVAAFFRAEQLGTTVVWLSISILLQSLAVVHKALLLRSLAFKKAALIEVTAAFGLLVGAFVALALGFGINSIAFGWCISAGIAMLSLWLMVGWRPLRIFEVGDFVDILRFSSSVLGTRLIANYNASIDSLIMGKVLGPVPLGSYSIAYRLAAFPRSNIAFIFSRVLFPTFSSIQDDNHRIRQGYLKVIKFVSLATFPVMTMLFVVAPNFIRLLYGEGWEAAVFPLRALCIAGMYTAILTTVGAVYNAKGRPDLQLKIAIPRAIAYTVLLLVVVPMGLNVAAIGITAYTLVTGIPMQLIANSLIELPPKGFVSALVPAALSSVFGAAGAALSMLVLEQALQLSDWLIILIAVTVGSLVYVGSYAVIDLAGLREVLRLLISLIPRATPHVTHASR